MKKIILACALLLVLGSPSLAATCANTALLVKDATTPTPLTDPVPYIDTGDGSGNCMPGVDILKSALPTGGATSANQSSQITQETATAGALGTTADTAYSGSGSGTIVSILKWIGATLNSILTAIQSAIPAGSNVIGGIFGSPNVTQTDCSIALTTGGTAQNIISAGAGVHGFRIMNIDTSAGSGEPVWMSFTTTAAASTIASYPLAAPTATTFAGAGSYSAEFGSGTNGNVSVVAATTGHKISCTKW